MSDIRIVAFGELEAGVWGFGWLGGLGGPAQVAVARGSTAEVFEATLTTNGPDESWRLEGDRVVIDVTPTGPAVPGGISDELQTFDQLCTVTGNFGLQEGPSELQSPGWRSSGRSRTEIEKVDSFRWLAAWLGPAQGFSLLALRPRRGRGQEDDILAATVIDDPPVPRIDDPRLSTTYDEAGLPVRVGVELWLEAQAEAETDPEAPPQYPHRAAGQVVSRGAELTGDGFGLRAFRLRWRSQGREGPGLYVLGQRP